ARDAENTRTGGRPLDRKAALVHQPVLTATEKNEIVEIGSAPKRPRDDVMPVAKAPVRAAGKATATVALAQGEVEGGWDRSRPPAHVKGTFAAFDEHPQR